MEQLRNKLPLNHWRCCDRCYIYIIRDHTTRTDTALWHWLLFEPLVGREPWTMRHQYFGLWLVNHIQVETKTYLKRSLCGRGPCSQNKVWNKYSVSFHYLSHNPSSFLIHVINIAKQVPFRRFWILKHGP